MKFKMDRFKIEIIGHLLLYSFLIAGLIGSSLKVPLSNIKDNF